MAIEREIKFTVPDRTIFGKLAALESIAGYGIIDRGVRKQTDYYFDTPDNRLFHGKAVYRLRVINHKSVLTFKSHGKSAGTIYERIETEAETTATPDEVCRGKLPVLPPAEAFRTAIGDLPLHVSMINDNHRHQILLTCNNIPHYEMVLDSVTFTGPHGTAQVYEIEVESLFDTDSDLGEIAAWFRKNYRLKHAGPSKYIMGMQLVGMVQ